MHRIARAASGLALLSAAAIAALPAHVGKLESPLVGSCAQPPASTDSAMAPAGNGWTYLYQSRAAVRLWRWTGSRWANARNARAPSLQDPAMAPDMHGSGMILVGSRGAGAPYRLSLQTWRWRDGRWTRLQPSTSPVGGYYRAELSLAPDRTHGDLLLVETISDAHYAVHNELWGWNGSTWRRLTRDRQGQITGTTVPAPIATGPGGAVFGFLGTGFSAGRFVRWDGHAFVPVSVAGGPQAVAALKAGPADRSLIVLGGPSPHVPDTPFPTVATYLFDGTLWSHSSLPAPLKNRVGMLLAPDPKHAASLLWGGQPSYGFIVRSRPRPSRYPTTWQRRTQWVQIERACS